MKAAEKNTTQVVIDILNELENSISSALETLEVVADRETLKSIEKGIEDIKEGRVISFEDFLKKHGKGYLIKNFREE